MAVDLGQFDEPTDRAIRGELAYAIRQDAARLDADGLTLAQVAMQLGISDEAVRSAVLTAETAGLLASVRCCPVSARWSRDRLDSRPWG